MTRILEALNSLNPADLSYDDWLRVGMALKREGCGLELWDVWSQNDSRYRPGVCAAKWNSFNDCSAPVTAGTIFQMAKDRGWTDNVALDWNSPISYEPEENSLSPVRELRKYIRTLYKDEDIIGYVTTDVRQSENLWMPGRGVYCRTAGEIIRSLDRHPDDLSETLGKWQDECGAWIRFNPLDGKGVRNENVTAFRYCLVESDSMPTEQQEKLYRELKLPIACLVHSGNKSLHAIVHIDAKDQEEYRQRVERLYGYLAEKGVDIDRANRNPSRLSRMPGVTRKGKRQRLLAVNIGCKSWDDWVSSIEGDIFPGFDTAQEYREEPPVLNEVLIDGVLRCGHKMLISSSSKAGKSFLLLELAIALTEGLPWLGFRCRKSRVLYVNLEIDRASLANRIISIYSAMGVVPDHAEDLLVWNLRGKAVPLDALAPVLIKKVKGKEIDAVIIDPIYKVITGDENNASEMGRFCNQFDKICAEANVACIYCHHHSKGLLGARRAMDRASGSGVFARDPDAQLDMIQLDLDEETKVWGADGNATAWRLEGTLREFRSFKPINLWFEYPLHHIDEHGILSGSQPEGKESNLKRSKKRTSAEERRQSIETAFNALNFDGTVTVNDIASYLGVTEKTVRERLKEMTHSFTNENGIVSKTEGNDVR